MTVDENLRTGTSEFSDSVRRAGDILIIEARFYEDIGDALVDGAVRTLKIHGVGYERISVPGALEIPQVLGQAIAAGLFGNGPNKRFAGAVALGCVIRGETAHYDIVCNNANHWLMDAAMKANVPVGNGILTVENRAQAMARAEGGSKGKGGDAARACLRLIEVASAWQGQRV